MIAAETLLLDRDSEKRARLAALLPRVAPADGYTRSEMVSAIEWAYGKRSEFVHSGGDVYPEWDESFKEGLPQKQTKLLKLMVARLIVDMPRLTSLDVPNGTAPANWFGYLRNEWDAVLRR